MPHDGHGRPIASTHPHGGSPSCPCVPCPAADGVSPAATPSTPRHPTPTPAATIRTPGAAPTREFLGHYFGLPVQVLDAVSVDGTWPEHAHRIHPSWGDEQLLTTHILNEVEALCDRVVQIDGGKLVHDE